ncbi:MAG: PilW family protein [Gammaproteobacteria bacterium]|nr:PilW family protein [Gammaproteobacteria bacterium]
MSTQPMSTQQMKSNISAAMNPKFKQKGLTLIEIMISITISLILLGGVVQILASSKMTYRVQDAAARVQESGRFGIHFLTGELRMAGYMGCGSIVNNPINIVDMNNDGIPDEAANFTGNGLMGYEYSGTLSVPLTDTLNLTAANIIADTDVVTIKRGSSTGVRLQGQLTAINANIQLDPATADGMFDVGDILFISDCEFADVFTPTTVSGGGGAITIAHSNAVNTENFLSTVYDDDAEVMRMVNTTFYLATGASGEPSLFRSSLGNGGAMVAQELVEGVSDMQITYGEDTNVVVEGKRSANVYVTANNVTDWTNVVNVRITLTIRSAEDNIATSVTAEGDRRLRRSFTTSITIRNRVV